MTVTWWSVGRQGIHTRGDTVQKRIIALAGAWHVDSYMATAVPITTLDLVRRPVMQVDGVTLRSREVGGGGERGGGRHTKKKTFELKSKTQKISM